MHIAIAGFGPRGLAAAEFALALHAGLKIDVFDPCAVPAAGPNFMPDEPDQCLLNLPPDAIDLPVAVRGVTSFADFAADMSGLTVDADSYLPRNMLGAYFAARFAALRRCCRNALVHHAGLVTDAWQDGQGWWLTMADATFGPYDALLLSMGQPASHPDDQIARWQSFAADHDFAVLPAYPGRGLVAAAQGWTGKTVAIRGLGLSAFDVAAMLSLGMGGTIIGGRYHRSGQEPRLIVPFSRDGLPPMPKPVRSEEPRYALEPEERADILTALRCALDADAATARHTIATALTPAVTRIAGLDAVGWLQTEVDPEADHPAQEPVTFLQEAVAMAEGRQTASRAYATGQIWRGLQPDLRALFHQTDAGPATRAAIIAIDHGLKRITYGPPVASARLMLALVETGLVQLGLADEPDITLTDAGWVLDHDVTAQVMIDAVLPAPELATINDPLILSLLRKGHLRKDPSTGAILLGRGGRAGRGLAVLGRMGEGSAIATDSIHDCFGITTRTWAADLAVATARQSAQEDPAHA